MDHALIKRSFSDPAEHLKIPQNNRKIKINYNIHTVKDSRPRNPYPIQRHIPVSAIKEVANGPSIVLFPLIESV